MADAERPNMDNLFDEDVPIPPIENQAAVYDVVPHDVVPLDQPIPPRRAAPARAPSPISTLKRKTSLEEERGKRLVSKSARMPHSEACLKEMYFSCRGSKYSAI